MTLSARASTLGGIVTAICFAVFKLITRSNFIGCSTNGPNPCCVVLSGGRTVEAFLAFSRMKNINSRISAFHVPTSCWRSLVGWRRIHLHLARLELDRRKAAESRQLESPSAMSIPDQCRQTGESSGQSGEPSLRTKCRLPSEPITACRSS